MSGLSFPVALLDPQGLQQGGVDDARHHQTVARLIAGDGALSVRSHLAVHGAIVVSLLLQDSLHRYNRRIAGRRSGGARIVIIGPTVVVARSGAIIIATVVRRSDVDAATEIGATHTTVVGVAVVASIVVFIVATHVTGADVPATVMSATAKVGAPAEMSPA